MVSNKISLVPETVADFVCNGAWLCTFDSIGQDRLRKAVVDSSSSDRSDFFRIIISDIFLHNSLVIT